MSAAAIISRVRRLQKLQADRIAPKATAVQVQAPKADLDHWKDDFVGFASNLDIATKDGPLRKLRPNAIQAAFESARTGRDYVLKPRQVGLTTWELARDVWFFLTRPGTNVVVVCQSDKDDTYVRDNSEKIQRMLDSLADVGIRLNFKSKSPTKWVIAGTGSSLRVMSAGASQRAAQKKGRSGTIHRLHVTEAAFFEHAATTMNALLECVPPAELGTEVVVESTANGAAGWFFERYTAAKKGHTPNKAHFFSWLRQAEYRIPLEPGEIVVPANDNDRERELVERHGATREQLKWYRAKVADKGSVDEFDQEYPTDEETCWITPGRPFFLKAQTRKLLALCVPPATTEEIVLDGAYGELRIWNEPEPDVEFVIIVDPSEGVGGDPGAASVFRRSDGLHVATLHGQFPTWELAHQAALLGKRFNDAIIVVERNNHGHAVLQALAREQEYSNIFNGTDGRPGWLSNPITRATAIEAMEKVHRKGEWSTRDRAVLAEFLLFIVINRKPQAGPGAHDDLLMTHVIANDVLSRVLTSDDDGLLVGGRRR